MRRRFDRFAKAAFVVAIAFLAVLYGFLAAHTGWWPASWLRPALATIVQMQQADLRAHQLHPARFDESGVVVHEPDAKPGLTLLTSYWPEFGDTAGARLIDKDGQVVHRWSLDPTRLWPDDPHADGPKPFLRTENLFSEDNYVHGTWLLDDGDLLANIEFLGLVRVGADGRVVWRVDRRTHHSIHAASDGSFWVCAIRYLTENPTPYFGVNAPASEDLVLQVSAEGEVLREISMLETLAASRYWKEFLQIQTAAPSPDPLHLNDVEPLPPELADQYPMFEAGDLLVSLRNIHMVLVLDPDDGTIRWADSSSWYRQHDPDWIGDGWISVYDNGLLASRLVAVQPHTRSFRQIFPTDQTDGHFASTFGGKAQKLDGTDGGWLITEPEAGRVVEIDGDGRIVWSWIQSPQASTGLVAEVLEGTLYPLTADQIADWR